VRYQGKITDWKDEKGFGFITPNGGGQRVFIHIKSFSNGQQRPVGNELVAYELTHDAKGRPQANSVAFVGKRVTPTSPSGQANTPLILAATFFVFVAASVFAGKLPIAVMWVYLIASLVAFITYALDKSAARNDQWRTKESTLHLFALAGGWPGALAAQRLLRHKSSKQSFQFVFWVTVILNCCALAWFFSTAGAEALRSMLGTA
jgi:uncharacterized membrane protein YsdA (DUF1294 family)/cold shock CspA family protein